MTEPGLTEDDFRKIREAVESDAYSMAEALTDNSKRNPNVAAHDVGARECALIRCMRGCGKSNNEIMDATEFCAKTVRLHATGRCSHSERVPAPPTVLREGPHTEGINHEKTHERRREWRESRREEKTVAPGAARQAMTDGGAVLHITFKRDPIKKGIVRDAQNADDFPEGDLHEVVVDPDEITVEGTPEGIRWLYDWLHWAKRSHRKEESIQHAQYCEDMAETIWEAADGELPDRQRARRML